MKNIHFYWIYSTLPKIGEYVSGEYIYLYWIYSAKIRGIYDSWRVSVRPSGAGSGKRWIGDHVSVEYMYLYWIYFAHIWGIYDSWMVSVRPLGAGLRNKQIF